MAARNSRAFWRIVLPLMRAPLLVVGAICFAQAYGQFVYPITLLNQQHLQPGSVGIYAFIGAEFADWHRVMAFASIYRPAYPRPVPAVAKEYRVWPDCRSAEVMRHGSTFHIGQIARLATPTLRLVS